MASCLACPTDHGVIPVTLVNGLANLCGHHRQRAAEAGLIRMEESACPFCFGGCPACRSSVVTVALPVTLAPLTTTGNQAVSAHINAAVNGERRRRGA